MGEAAEARDDIAVLDGMLHVLFVVERGEQGAAQFLVTERLAVLERQVEEGPHREVEGRRIESRQRQPRRFQCLAVAGEGARRLAVHVAGKLVAQNDVGQRPVGRLPPGIEDAVERSVESRAEAVADLGVEFRRTLPPDLARLAAAWITKRQEPEIEDIADGRAVGHGGSLLVKKKMSSRAQ